MNRILLAVTFIICFYSATAQSTPADSSVIYPFPDVKAEYPGGIKEFYNFFSSNFVAPEIEADTEFNFYFSYVVEADGALSNVQIIRDPGYGIGTEALRVINLSPKWKPAVKDNVPVRTNGTLPLIINVKKQEAQENKAPANTSSTVDVQPQYPGGTINFNIEVQKRMDIPEIEKNIDVVAYVSFVVDIDGSITDIKCIKDPGYGIGREAANAVKGVDTKWKPALKNGTPVACLLTLPVRIRITGPKLPKSPAKVKDVGPPIYRNN